MVAKSKNVSDHMSLTYSNILSRNILQTWLCFTVFRYESKRKTWLQIVKFSASPICVFFFFFSEFFHFFTVFPFIVCSFFHGIFFPSYLYITLYLHCFDIFCFYTSFGEKKKVKRKIHKKTQIHEKKRKKYEKKDKSWAHGNLTFCSQVFRIFSYEIKFKKKRNRYKSYHISPNIFQILKNCEILYNFLVFRGI